MSTQTITTVQYTQVSVKTGVRHAPADGSFSEVKDRIDREEQRIPTTPNKYADQVKEALRKVCGTAASTQMQTLMELMGKDPKQSVSELLIGVSKGASATRTATLEYALNAPMISPVKGQSLYPVPEGTPTANVAPEWGADAVSTRIVQLASYFLAVLPGDMKENIQKVRDAMEKGFQMANDKIGAVPADLAQLFNETYEATWKKFDQIAAELGDAKQEPEAESKDESQSATYTRPWALQQTEVQT